VSERLPRFVRYENWERFRLPTHCYGRARVPNTVLCANTGTFPSGVRSRIVAKSVVHAHGNSAFVVFERMKRKRHGYRVLLDASDRKQNTVGFVLNVHRAAFGRKKRAGKSTRGLWSLRMNNREHGNFEMSSFREWPRNPYVSTIFPEFSRRRKNGQRFIALCPFGRRVITNYRRGESTLCFEAFQIERENRRE